MEMESTDDKLEVVAENPELDIVEHVGEAGRLNAVRVELGLSGRDKSPTGMSSGLSGSAGMKLIGRGNASK